MRLSLTVLACDYARLPKKFEPTCRKILCQHAEKIQANMTKNGCIKKKIGYTIGIKSRECGLNEKIYAKNC